MKVSGAARINGFIVCILHPLKSSPLRRFEISGRRHIFQFS
jgi:hypothetical protein